MVHFNSLLTHKEFVEFDYGPRENLKRYGQEDVPVIPTRDLKDSKVPIALYCGIEDTIVSIHDSRWLRDEIGEDIVDYEEFPGGHLQFFIGKDASYFTENSMKLITKYN